MKNGTKAVKDDSLNDGCHDENIQEENWHSIENREFVLGTLTFSTSKGQIFQGRYQCPHTLMFQTP